MLYSNGVFVVNKKRRRDPTQTITLRNRFARDMARRFIDLRVAIRKSIVDNDCFGLKENVLALSEITTNAPRIESITPQKYKYYRNARKVEAFMEWLREMQQRGILEVFYNPRTGATEPWMNTYIRSAYQNGVITARNDLRAAGLDLPTWEALPGDSFTIGFNMPIHSERIALIYTRVFDELRGVTEAMDRQISRILARGIAEGKNPNVIARGLADRVNKIGITRAKLIARTEVIHVHNEAALNEYRVTEEIIDEEILVQWFGTLDDRIRETHEDRHLEIFSKEKGEELIGEPNCRCALIPYIPSIHGRVRSIGDGVYERIPDKKKKKTKVERISA